MPHISIIIVYLQRVFHGIRLLRLMKRLVVVRQSIFFPVALVILELKQQSDGQKGSLRRFPFPIV